MITPPYPNVYMGNFQSFSPGPGAIPVYALPEQGKAPQAPSQPKAPAQAAPGAPNAAAAPQPAPAQ